MIGYYAITGTLCVREDAEGLQDAIKKFDDLRAEFVQIDLSGDSIFIQAYGEMSETEANRWSNSVSSLAEAFAVETAVFLETWENDDSDLYVGPAGFDQRQAEIDHLESKIGGLRERQNELKKDMQNHEIR
jgi:hypothetical protein